MTGNEPINTSSPLSSTVWELPPLYKRINWAALLVPPVGVILLLFAAMYLFPYLKKRLGGNESKQAIKDDGHLSEEKNSSAIDLMDDIHSNDSDSYSMNNTGSIDRLQSTPRHKLVTRTTPTPSPKLGRLSLSPSPPLASQENILF